MGAHIIDGEFQSDKYPTCPAGKVPLSTKDPTAWDLLWEYAQRRRAVDAEFADDLEAALQAKGYAGPATERYVDADPSLVFVIERNWSVVAMFADESDAEKFCSARNAANVLAGSSVRYRVARWHVHAPGELPPRCADD
jgi:hypothetical protein